ncbi:phospholipid-binding protein MlaC, partial [Providencia huaxiensis]
DILSAKGVDGLTKQLEISAKTPITLDEKK